MNNRPIKHGVRIKLIFTFFFLFIGTVFVSAQNTYVDSLEKILPGKKGKERIEIVGELSYMYCYINTDKALKYAREELKLAQITKDSLLIAQAFHDMGAVYTSKGDFKTAISIFSNALRIREGHADSMGIAKTLINIGYANQEIGNGDEALTAYLRSAKIFEEIGQEQYLVIIYNNIGAIYLRQGSEKKASEYLKKAIIYSEKFNDKGGLINAKTNLAGILFEKGDYTKSEKYYLEILDVITSSGISNQLPIVLMNLGVCKTRKGEFDKGLNYVLQAIPLYEEKQDNKGLGMALVNAGISYIWMNDLNNAEKFLLRGKKLCEETGSNIQLYFAYEALHRLEFAKGNYQKAMQYFNKMKKYENLVHNETTTAKLAEMEVKYQTEKKEKELSLKNAQLFNAKLKNRKNQLIIISLALGMILILSLTVFSVRNNRLKREKIRQQSKLELQDERLRISRDLHDNIGAELTLISSTLDAKAFKSDSEKEKNELENISNFSRNAMSQLRETIWAIRNESNSLEVFATRIREYSGKLCAPLKIEPEVNSSLDREFMLSPAKTINLYRLCQEAIHNAVKHAHCTRLSTTITAHSGQIKIVISDNGKGFDTTATEKGNGIANMKSRAKEIGGIFQLNSSPGQKTEVIITLIP